MMIGDMQREMLVHVISEAVYGTDPTVGTPSVWLAVISCVIQEVREFRQDQSVRGVHSPGRHISMPSHCDVSIEGYLTGRAGAAGTPPAWAPMLKAANLKETIDVGVGVSYNPVTITDDMAVVPSMTLYKYQKMSNGQVMLQKASGIRGNLTFTFEHGQRIKFKFEGKGLYSEWADPASAPANPTAYSGDGAGMLAQGMVATLEAEPLPLETFELATNWTLEENRTMTGATNLDSVKPKRGEDSAAGGSFGFRARSLLLFCLTNYRLDSAMALSLAASNANATITLTAPAVQLGQFAPTPGNIYSFSVPFWLRGDFGTSSGEDDFTLAFT